MSNKKIVLASVIAAAMSVPAYADTIGLYIGAQAWQSEASGGFGESNDMTDFSYENQTKPSFYAKIEHPLPLIPNVRLRTGKLEGPGSTSLSSDFSFGSQTYQGATDLDTNVEFVNSDITLYWEILDNDLVGFDIGINAKYLSGDFDVRGSDENAVEQTSVEHASLWIPMAYVGAKVAVPFTGVFVYGDVNFVSYDDNSVHDYEVGIGYNFVDNMVVDVALTLGYREVSIELDDVDDIYADMQFDGFFAGLEVHF